MRGEFDFNTWAQPDTRPPRQTAEDVCKTRKEQEIRTWERTIFVPDDMQPIDLIQYYSHDLPLPPFHSLQLTVNKKDVECIASAMLDPNLHWRNLYHFTIAPYDGPQTQHTNKWVLISGHHRFLAYLLASVGPSENCPLQITKAPFATSLFPWSSVIWGK